jgi:hypothetical protein
MSSSRRGLPRTPGRVLFRCGGGHRRPECVVHRRPRATAQHRARRLDGRIRRPALDLLHQVLRAAARRHGLAGRSERTPSAERQPRPGTRNAGSLSGSGLRREAVGGARRATPGRACGSPAGRLHRVAMAVRGGWPGGAGGRRLRTRGPRRESAEDDVGQGAAATPGWSPSRSPRSRWPSPVQPRTRGRLPFRHGPTSSVYARPRQGCWWQHGLVIADLWCSGAPLEEVPAFRMSSGGGELDGQRLQFRAGDCSTRRRRSGRDGKNDPARSWGVATPDRRGRGQRPIPIAIAVRGPLLGPLRGGTDYRGQAPHRSTAGRSSAPRCGAGPAHRRHAWLRAPWVRQHCPRPWCIVSFS